MKTARASEASWGVLALDVYRPVQELRQRPKFRDRLTEISINGPRDVWVRVAGEGYLQLPANDAAFATRQWFGRFCSFMAAEHGVNWSADLPLIACRTPDGDRFMGIEGANVESGMAASIRIKRMKKVEYRDFGLGEAAADRIAQGMADGENIFLSGGTGSGKTTLFNRMCRDIPTTHRVLTAEDTRELEIGNPNRVHFIVSRTEARTRIRYNEITDTVLRLNPDRYIFGELSIQNAFAMMQALDTGHEGAGTTGHANSAFDFMRGMRRRVALGGGMVGAEIQDMLEFIADNVHLIMQVKHQPVAGDTERRRVTEMERPKDLLDRRRRQGLVEAMRHDDKVIDLARARDVLLQANAGEALKPHQEEVLRTLALLGFFQTSSARPATNDAGRTNSAGDAALLGPEERFLVSAGAHPATADGPGGGPGSGEYYADGHGNLADESFAIEKRKA